MKDMNYWELRKRFAPISRLIKSNLPFVSSDMLSDKDSNKEPDDNNMCKDNCLELKLINEDEEKNEKHDEAQNYFIEDDTGKNAAESDDFEQAEEIENFDGLQYPERKIMTGDLEISQNEYDKRGLSEFAYIYSTEQQLVENNAAIVFNSPTTTAPIFHAVGTSTISLTEKGSYLIKFEVASQLHKGVKWSIALNGIKTQPDIYTTKNDDSQTSGEAIITITSTPTNITIVNYSGEDLNISSELNNRELNKFVSAAIVIIKIN